MKQTVYLSYPVIDVLKCLGPSLDDVVNQILAYGEQGLFDLENKPPVGTRTDGKHCTINVTNQHYIDLVATLGEKNNNISLRRLLHWFVEEEIYEECGWEVTSGMSVSVIKERADRIKDYKSFSKIKSQVMELNKSYESNTLYDVIRLLNKFEQEELNE